VMSLYSSRVPWITPELMLMRLLVVALDSFRNGAGQQKEQTCLEDWDFDPTPPPGKGDSARG
jgi:hypothetical protein